MKKLLITTAVLFTALPFTFDGVTPTVSKAHAIIGRPLTPFSVAGVHRRAMRRTYGLGWRGGVGYSRYGYGFRHPVAAAAIYRHRRAALYAYGAGYYGAGYGGGYGYHPCALTLSCSPWAGGGYLDPVARVALLGGGWGGWGGGYGGLYSYAGAAPGWGGGWGWNRPFLGVGLGFAGGPPVYGGWGWRRW